MKPNALVLVDSLTIRMDLSDALGAAGFDTIPCRDLGSARVALGQPGVSLLVLDPDLSDGDGLDLLDELRERPATRSLPVLLVAGPTDPGRAARAARLANEIGSRPYDTEGLVAVAQALVAAGRSDEAGPGAQTVRADLAETPTPLDRRRTILVIDDSPTYRGQVTEALTALGYDVFESDTGEAGLTIVGTARPDAIIVDGLLPGIDGATFVRRIKSDSALRSTLCLLLTAAEGTEYEVRSLEAGADAYVRKGEDLGVMLARLAALMRGTRIAVGDDLPSLLGPKRLLAVDDSATYLQALGAQLRDEGHDVVLAESGEEALELLAVHPVDCILLDLNMPGLSGQETCRRIKQTPEWRDIPLVILTAQDERDAMIEGINAGADDYIAKSADFDVLKARLRAQLRRKHFEDENRQIREKLVRREAEINYTRALEQANRELAIAKEQAEQSNRFKSSFLANMSHELRTPLNAIIGFAELLHDGHVQPDMPEHQEFLGDILTSGRHLLQLINDVLDLSKVEAGKLEFHPEPVSLPGLVSEVLGVLRNAASDKRVPVESEIHPELLTGVAIDPARFKQILYNYVSNALKFTSEGGTIHVRATPEPAGAFRLEVQDSGIGIAEEDVDRLFSEFEQLDAGAAKRHAGTGLGLALTKRLAEAQGGSVGLRSELGVGSTFSAILPRRATRGRPLPAPAVIAGAPGAPTILVVEDREADQAQIAHALSAAHYRVETAATGAQALSMCRARAYDAITLDLLLPDASGLEVLRAIRAEGPNRRSPVVVITVVDDPSVLGGLTAHAVLGKPVHESTLIDSLRRAGVSAGREGTVLIVDDDPGSTRLMAAQLAQLGYGSLCAGDAAAGLRAAESAPPLAVVLDLLMPEMDGFEFLERFRQLPGCATTPVIVWTSADVSDRELARLGPSVLSVLQKGRDVGGGVLEEIRAVLSATEGKGG